MFLFQFYNSYRALVVASRMQELVLLEDWQTHAELACRAAGAVSYHRPPQISAEGSFR